MAILSRTPATLAALLRGLPEAWTTATEGVDTWSAHAVVGHLLSGDESDWIPRARIILEHGEARPFDTFNRTAMFTKYQGATLDDLLAAFARLRAENLAALAALEITPDKLARKGTHPTLGAVTLAQLLATWVAHDLNHIGQVVEVLARQYDAAVGPWRQYLAILTRPVLTE
ncbi:MAG TPA: DinB family protein [Ktedonobacterales bacterium]|nr:DinB family protein [Ktedonobacterales bacterium]